MEGAYTAMGKSPPRCPQCGEMIDSADSTEHQILHSIEFLTRRAGKATTLSIAGDIFLSSSQTWRYLRRLEDDGQVRRIGARGGWKRAA